MSIDRRDFLKFSGAAAILAAWGGPFSRFARAEGELAPSAADPAYHFLNRISWGVRQADLDRVREIGIEKYLDEQLSPETIKGANKVRVSSLLKADRLRGRKGNRSDKTYEALIHGMITRAAANPAQLYERVVEFWSDHFNIASEGLEVDLVDFQREVIRKHAFGNFAELLKATAQHPAMLYYLDNYLNVAEHPNENYARELMELHTLGVDGGYTEADVKAVARAFSGWTINDDEKPGGFFFDAENHDEAPKIVLGIAMLPGRGVEDGLDVLAMLANHPSTIRFVCRKLCVRFVSDRPPQTLIDTLAGVWAQNNGEIKPILRALFLSPEFAASAGQKLRRPLDFFVGALRTTGAELRNVDLARWLLSKLGQVPYDWHPPNGYPDVAAAWANSNGMLERWNSSQILTDGAFHDKKSGLKTQLYKKLSKMATAGMLVDLATKEILAAQLPGVLRGSLVSFVADGGDEYTGVTKDMLEQKAGPLCGLLLSSPMFQWR
jgi:hypothetical protein